MDRPHPLLVALRSQPVRLAAPALVLTAVVGASIAYTRADKHVTLSVDGQTRTVSVFAHTVGDLLADQHILLGRRDLVAPGLSDPIRDGSQVVVRYARPVSLTLNGTSRVVWTTELTVEDALRSMGVRAGGARVSVSRSLHLGRTGVALSVNTPKTVTLVADRQTRTVSTTAASVAGLLLELGVRTDPLDQIAPAAATSLSDGGRVTLVRILRARQEATEPLRHTTLTRRSGTLAAGTRRVVTAGRDGRRSAVYELTTVDGRLSARRLLSATLTSRPVTEVVLTGTRRAAPAARPHRARVTSAGKVSRRVAAEQPAYVGGGGHNWAAVAACESGGNPRAVSPNGLYRGLYQFSISTWHSVGGSGDPINASPAEQTKRAQILYDGQGSNPWPVCGKRL